MGRAPGTRRPTIKESSTVEAIAARLGLRCDQTRHRLAKFRVVVLQSDLGFGHCVEIGIDDNDAQDRILVVSSIEFEPGAAEVLPLREDLVATPADSRLRRGSSRQFSAPPAPATATL